MTDARFEDGAEQPLRLLARDVDDLQVISTLAQDSVLTGAELRYSPARRRFSLLLNRFRWEDQPKAQAAGRRVERVRSVLDFSDVTSVSHQGLTQDSETILSLLAIEFTAEAEVETGEPAGPGRIVLTFAGDGALALSVECLEVELCDVTRPYGAPSGQVPSHNI